jgi:hypothetical protein
MEKCALCKGKLKKHKEKKDGVDISGWKCTKCNETFFSSHDLLKWEVLSGSSHDLLKWEVLSGRRKDNVRKIRKVGNSFTVTFPNIFVKKDEIHDNDLATYKKKKDGYLVQIIHT